MLSLGSTDNDKSLKIDMHVVCSWLQIHFQLRHFHDGRTKKIILYVSATTLRVESRKWFEFFAFASLWFLTFCVCGYLIIMVIIVEVVITWMNSSRISLQVIRKDCQYSREHDKSTIYMMVYIYYPPNLRLLQLLKKECCCLSC